MRQERLIQVLSSFKNICLEAASLSEDGKHQVGAIVFRKNFTSIPSVAFNGNYAGGPNRRDSEASGESGYIHAEINAIIRAGLTPENAGAFALMVSLAPCKMCAKVIVNSGIKSVFVLKRHAKSVEFEHIFSRAGVRWMSLDPEDSREWLYEYFMADRIRYVLGETDEDVANCDTDE